LQKVATIFAGSDYSGMATSTRTTRTASLPGLIVGLLAVMTIAAGTGYLLFRTVDRVVDGHTTEISALHRGD
jgi:hypothetical protein